MPTTNNTQGVTLCKTFVQGIAPNGQYKVKGIKNQRFKINLSLINSRWYDLFTSVESQRCEDIIK